MNEAQRHLLRQRLLLGAKPDLRRGEITDATPGAVEIALGGADESVPAELIAGGYVAVGDIVDALVAGNAPPLILAVTTPAFTDLTLENSWVAYGGSYSTPGFCVDHTGRCFLRGAVKNGSSATATIATLPSGARPAGVVRGLANTNSMASPFQITTAGAISVYSGGSTLSVFLEGISFRI